MSFNKRVYNGDFSNRVLLMQLSYQFDRLFGQRLTHDNAKSELRKVRTGPGTRGYWPPWETICLGTHGANQEETEISLISEMTQKTLPYSLID